MRNLLFLVLGILMMSSCNKDDVLNTPNNLNNGKNASLVFSGVKRSPQTKGVAQERNLWRAGMTLRIKFLDGTTEEHDKVKEYAKEWMKYANIKFDYITTGNADVRITFEDEAKEISWSYVGSDAKAVSDQSKPTANLAYFGFFDDDEEDRTSVLRLFGQILGLELEHRHLDFDPKWNPNKDIKNYWTENITDTPWELLKEYVLEPLIDDQIIQTEGFDNESIMKWGFPKAYSKNAALLEKNMNSELSDMDKKFIGELYPFSDIPKTDPTILNFVFSGEYNTLFLYSIFDSEDEIVIDFGNGDVYKGKGNNAPVYKYNPGNYKMKIYADTAKMKFGGFSALVGISFSKSTIYTEINLRGCRNLISIECKSAPNFTQTVFRGTFSNCSKLETIPENLFEKCVLATDFGHVFNNCYTLTHIPEGLFKNCINVLDFTTSFGYCDKLNTIPKDLFANNTKVIDFSLCFTGSESLKNIPEELFANNINTETFSYCFQRSSIENIPENLFSNNINVTNLFGCFSNCGNIRTIPKKLFANLVKVKTFENCFENCTSITGNVPKLWETHIQSDGKYCFSKCVNAANYNEIPVNWK